LATFALNRGVPYVLSHPRSILSRKVQELVSKLFNVKAVAQPTGQSAGQTGAKEGRKLFSFGSKGGRTVQEAIAQ
jgi:MinD-like ATPase involved in chromosome partitioning or flagellar assembly